MRMPARACLHPYMFTLHGATDSSTGAMVACNDSLLYIGLYYRTRRQVAVQYDCVRPSPTPPAMFYLRSRPGLDRYTPEQKLADHAFWPWGVRWYALENTRFRRPPYLNTYIRYIHGMC